MDKTPGDPTAPIEQLRGGDRQALGMLFDQYRQRLRRRKNRDFLSGLDYDWTDWG
jgi:hypothetical protein